MQCSDSLPTSPLALLTRAQYDNTVADLLGDTSHPSSIFPPENQVEGFKNNTTAHQVSPLLVETYLDAAEGIATRATAGDLTSLAPCADGADQNVCGQNFVSNFGKRAFRRPLNATESQLFDDLFLRTLQTQGYRTAVQLVLEAILQSPQFLYRVDTRVAPTETTGAIALDPYEIAARLSYFLTGSMPDATLFAAADNNELQTDAQIETQTRRLLETPRARDVVREFHHEWLGLDGLPDIVRSSIDLPSDQDWLGKDLLTSFDMFIDRVFWEQGNYTALFESKDVYLNGHLAPLFNVSYTQSDFALNQLQDRSGLITQPALMTILAHPNQTAPVQRGVFVIERLMCLSVPPPPPTVNNTPPDPDPSLTTRQRFDVHTKNPECAACHNMIDGVGFGFEAYDQIGRYRTSENALPVDASGDVEVSDATLDGKFNGAAELAARLEASPRVRDCVANSWYRFALGRLETQADLCSLKDIRAKFAANGQLQDLLVAITQSVAFRYRPATGAAQ